ncbi:MAG: cupin domain-containing protein [Acidobacteria bacterium]|nr:MAG: cupin domain-containing protein [Acidobacteriota bacterium]REK09177.1 MAG: cupin domain-containing protein [Acidobacteriota bacterium]
MPSRLHGALERIDLAEKLASFDDAWNPRIVAELNGQEVRLVKLRGEFVWHSHADADELFLVLRGELEMHLRDRVVPLAAGDAFVVPRGVEHKPVAPTEAHVLLFEPAGTVNTGDASSERAGSLRRQDLDRT